MGWAHGRGRSVVVEESEFGVELDLDVIDNVILAMV